VGRRDAAKRDLLIGLLAFQNGLVDEKETTTREQLFAPEALFEEPVVRATCRS
jgi:hypothetical protein